MKQSKVGLCIFLVLSIIYGATMFFSGITMTVAMPFLNRYYAAHPEFLEEFHATVAWETMSSIPRLFFAAMALLGALSATGCILMWNLRRSGFHCYAIAQLLMLLLPLLFLGKAFMGIGDIMFTILFVTFYYLQMRRLGVFGYDDAVTPPSEGDSEQV